MKKTVSLLLLALVSTAVYAHRLSSPSGKLSIEVNASGGVPVYTLSFGGRTLISASRIGFDLEEGYFGEGIRLGKVTRREVLDEYDLPVGKTSHVRSLSREMRVPLVEKSGLKRRVDMVVRAFDDAVAFRYEFPGEGKFLLKNEVMDIRPAGSPLITAMPLPGYYSAHEARYTVGGIEAFREGAVLDMPATFTFPGDVVLSVTEANLVHYAGMYLLREGSKFTSRLSPRRDRPPFSVIADLPHQTPWRVFLVSDNVGDLIKSNVLTTLCDPCEEEDLSWLKPGKTTFPWWNDTCVPDTSFQAGNNFLTAKYYIDFAAAHGIDYHSVYGYADMPWYVDDGPSFGQAGLNADLTRPVPQLDFEAVCRYAQRHGVDIHVWLNWSALYKDIDRVFDKFNAWGVKGMMVDFMDRDDQEMIEIQEEILRKALKHKLFIQFHGASKPSGLVRTYPNEFTREGALNCEVYKWDGWLIGPDHDINIPFTRLLAGPTDYHLGGFRAVTREDYQPRYHAPLVMGTRAHMLGLYIVLESYLHMVADDPRAYLGEPGFDFLCGIPTSWDRTEVPAARVNEYVFIARKCGEDWYLGAINNTVGRTVDVPLDFLGEGAFQAWICRDAEDSAEHPNKIIEEHCIINGRVLSVKLSAGGGFAARISPA